MPHEGLPVPQLKASVDINYIRDEVLNSAESVAALFGHYCQTDMTFRENILSDRNIRKRSKATGTFATPTVSRPEVDGLYGDK